MNPRSSVPAPKVGCHELPPSVRTGVNPIPLVDLHAQHAEVGDEVLAGWQAVLDATAFVGGTDVSAFEHEYEAFSGVKHCIGVGNGTDALELALRATGAGPGDDVLLPANTFIATALAVLRAGANPILCDVRADTHLIDPASAEARLTPHTKAIIPVHLFGQMAEMEPLLDLASSVNAAVIEDAAQAQGATQRGSPAGGVGTAAGTSFYPGKNLGAYGDAGAVLTMSDTVARAARQLRNYGSDVKYHHPFVGFNSRLDTIQAVVLRAKLRRLGEWNEWRRAAANRYDELLGPVDAVTLPVTAAGNSHVWHLYVIRLPDRDRVLGHLQECGIGAAVHYPVPVHLQGAFAHLGHRPGDFPVAEQAASEVLSLPLYPHITESQQTRIAACIREIL